MTDTQPTKDPLAAEIANLLHRMNLDRPDIKDLPDGHTIAINITTHRQAAAIIKEQQRRLEVARGLIGDASIMLKRDPRDWAIVVIKLTKVLAALEGK